MRWFSNHLLVDELTPDGIRAALRAGRSYVAFELTGTPVGVAFEAEQGGAVHTIGDVAPAEGAKLRVALPSIAEGLPEGAAPPAYTVRLYRATGTPDAAVEELVAEAEGALEVAAPGPGVYHAEVHVTPHHLRRWLGPQPERFLRQVPWVVTAAIRLE